MKSFTTSQEQDRRYRGSNSHPIRQCQSDRTKQIGEHIEHQNDYADIWLSLLVAFANVLPIEDSEPGSEHEKTAGKRNEMHWFEEVEHASGQRQQRECANAARAFR